MKEVRLLTATEVARTLAVKPARVHQLARAGLLPCIRMGRQVRFDPAAVTEWLEDGGRAWEGGWKRDRP